MDQGEDDSVQEHAKKPVWWHLLVIPALGRWRQEELHGLLASQFGELAQKRASLGGAFNSKTREAESDVFLGVQDQPGLQSEF